MSRVFALERLSAELPGSRSVPDLLGRLQLPAAAQPRSKNRRI